MNRNIFLILLLSLLFSIAACKQQGPAATIEKFVLSDTMLAHTGFTNATTQPVTSTLRLYGKIAAANNRQAQVYPVVGGSVVKVNVELGDYVQRGQVLAVIRSSEVADYERQRMDAANDVAVAEKNLQVARDMYAGRLSSQRDVVLAEKELEKARAAQQRINQVFSIYSIGKGAAYNVVAPIAGYVVDKNITENMQLRSDKSESIFSIAQIDEVWVMANVNETDISKVSQGMGAEVQTISYPDRIFKGQVDRIVNVLDETTKAMRARITIPNADGALKPEMSATVTLLMKENKSMIAIPSSAIIFDQSRNFVMVYKDRDQIETRPVTVYRKHGDITYISEGLAEDETVISKNQLLIYDALND